jgi:hypothetical protein
MLLILPHKVKILLIKSLSETSSLIKHFEITNLGSSTLLIECFGKKRESKNNSEYFTNDILQINFYPAEIIT